MRILGLAASHNGAAAIVEDGIVKAAVQLERLERNKRHPIELLPDRVAPGVHRAINYCLRQAGLTIEDVDAIAGSTPWELPGDFFWPHLPISWVPHHLAHAEYALHWSDLSAGLVLIADAHGTHESDRGRMHVAERIDPSAASFPGDMETLSAYRFDGRELSLIYRMRGRRDANGWLTSSVGQLWEIASSIIFGRRDQAGKVMGLAAYGQPRVEEPLFCVAEDGRLIARPELLARPGLTYRDLAHDLQAQTSRVLVELLAKLAAENGGARVLYYSGGVALNVVTNEHIARSGLFDRIHMNGSCEDNGTAIGAALALEHQTCGRRVAEPVREDLGAEHDRFTIRAELPRHPVEWEELSGGGIPSAAAERLASGEVLGWFQGRSEFGPRALGHRSILADPRSPRMKDRLNGRVKHRESFRPYGASCCLDAAARHFDLPGASPVMLREGRVLDPTLPAVTHADGTCRLQTVAREDDPRFFDLLACFGERTGAPVLVNTSMNVAGMPIAETPRDAIETLLRTELDALVIGDFLVRKR